MIAFSDEEGIRFQSTFLGSAALVGEFPEYLLGIEDKRCEIPNFSEYLNLFLVSILHKV